MANSFKALLCFILSILSVFSFVGCSAESESSSETTAPSTTQQTTAPSVSEATVDTASQSEETLDYNKIKQNADSIKTSFDNIITTYKFRGVVYSELGNDFEYIGTNGFSDKGKRTNNSINTAYYAGSLTQQFTAAAVMLLQQDGKLSVTDKLSEYYPDYKYGDEITIENLLTMTAGLEDYFYKGTGSSMSTVYRENELPYEISENSSAEENKESILNWILAQDTMFEPGEQFSYSNSAYFLLGDIIEIVSGTSYEKFMKENIFAPLSMTSSSFEPTDAVAVGYQEIYDNEWQLYPGVAYSAAGLITNVADILKWIDSLSYNTLLTEESFTAMTQPNDSNYGYGFFISDDGYYYSGSIYRFNSFVRVNSDMSDVFIAFSNYTQSDAENIYLKFEDYLTKYYE